MVALTAIAGIPLLVDEVTEACCLDKEALEYRQVKKVRLPEVLPTLLNKSLRYPEYVYESHCNVVRKQDAGDWPQDFSYDVISIPSGLLGIEYIKTHIFYTEGDDHSAACILQVLSGELTVFLQRNAENLDKYSLDVHVQDALILKVKKGQKAVIPAGFFYTFVNAGDESVIFATVLMGEATLAHESLRSVNGMAYYLIAKNARQEIVANPRYRTLVEVKKISIADMNKQVGYQPNEKPLYDEVKELAESLAEIFT